MRFPRRRYGDFCSSSFHCATIQNAEAVSHEAPARIGLLEKLDASDLTRSRGQGQRSSPSALSVEVVLSDAEEVNAISFGLLFLSAE
jgi:hypothetical protein